MEESQQYTTSPYETKGCRHQLAQRTKDSRWRLNPSGRIHDGGGDIEDDIIQDGGLIYP